MIDASGLLPNDVIVSRRRRRSTFPKECPGFKRSMNARTNNTREIDIV
jgi:hypothetical protein